MCVIGLAAILNNLRRISKLSGNSTNDLLGCYNLFNRLDLTTTTNRGSCLLQTAASDVTFKNIFVRPSLSEYHHRHRHHSPPSRQQLLSGQQFEFNGHTEKLIQCLRHNSVNKPNDEDSRAGGGDDKLCGDNKAILLKTRATTDCLYHVELLNANALDNNMPGTTKDDSHVVHKPNTSDLLSKSSIDNKMDDKAVMENCCWCHRTVHDNGPQYLAMFDGLRFCSEFCFIQSRRASFKKAKTCDCCKQVCQIVNYVDFQDGAVQLQFCSEKCLNQYKMQIFCKETQAHLDLIPHLKEQGIEAASNSASLITPELWLKNCSGSSVSPVAATTTNLDSGIFLNTTKETPPIDCSSCPHTNSKQKPLISVAPASKLMANIKGISKTNSRLMKHNRRKRIFKTDDTTDISMHKEVKDYSFDKTNGLVMSVNNNDTPLESNLSEEQNTEIRIKQCQTPNAPHITNYRYLPIPPLAPMYNTVLQPVEAHKSLATNKSNKVNLQSGDFMCNPTLSTSLPMPSTLPPRHHTNIPRFVSSLTAEAPECPATPFTSSSYPLDLRSLNPNFTTVPPITVMIPYPVIVPLPLPIPIPLPVVDFYKAYLTTDERKQFDEEQERLKSKTSNTEISTSESNKQNTKDSQKEPIDFTKVVLPANKHETNIKTENESELDAETEEYKQATSCTSNSVGDVTCSEPLVSHSSINSNGSMKITSKENQNVDKMKLNRLESKEYDSTRPLRKRKRIINSDLRTDDTHNRNQTWDNV